MGFEIGKLVRCINASFQSRSTDPFRAHEINLPELNGIYTIREVINTGYGIALRLEEIVNREYYHTLGGWQEPAFDSGRFRIIDDGAATEETDALFKRISTPHQKKKPVLISH